MLQAFDQVGLHVGKFAVVQLLQHVQMDHGGDHVIGRLDDVELGAASLHLGQQFFVIGIHVVINAAVIGFFKSGQYLGIKIIRPAITAAAAGESQGKAYNE